MIGGDQALDGLRLGLITNNGESSLFPNKRAGGRSALSKFSAVLIFVKAALATDPFIMVYLFHGGVVQTLLVCLLIVLLTQGSFAVLLRSWAIGEAYTFAGLWSRLFGARTAWVPHLFVFVAYLSCMSSEYWEIVDCVPWILGAVWPGAPEFVRNGWFLQYVPMLLIVAFMFWADHFRSFVPLSAVALVAAVVALLATLAYMVRHSEGAAYAAASETALFRPSFTAIYDAIKDFTGALFAQPFLPYVAAEMHDPTRNRLLSMTWIATLVTGFLCFVIPLAAFLVCPDIETDETYFYRFGDGEAPEVILGIACVLIVSVASNVFFTFFIAQQFVCIWVGDHTGDGAEQPIPHFTRGITAACAALIAVTVNFTNEYVELIWYNIAGFAYALLAFVFPGLFYFVQFRFRVMRWGVFSCVIIVLGAFVFVLTLIGLVQSLIEWE
jgi:hypothetical protein